MTDLLFVYGTLLPSRAPAHLRETAAHLKPLSPGFMPGRLYDLGDYPGAVSEPEAFTRVVGEVVQLPIDNAFLKKIDDYEGYNPDSPASSLFIRETRSITLPDGTHASCWVYLYNQDPASARLIPSGDYSHWQRDHRE